MPERQTTLEDLARLAEALGLEFSRERLEAALPEVRRLWEIAERLRTLPLDAPARGPDGAGADLPGRGPRTP